MINEIQIYRNGTPTVIVPIDEQTTYFDESMGRFDITVKTISPTPLDIKVDDYLIWNSIRFTINVPFNVRRSSVFDYDIVFEHPSRALTDIIMKHVGSIEFSFFGTPKEFLELIVNNMLADDTGWSIGEVAEEEPKFIDFITSGEGYSCRAALSMIAETFGLEFWFSGNGKTINITKQAGKLTNIDFEVGRGKGLYSIQRGVSETPLFNRILAYGGTENIGLDYRGGKTRLTFDPGYLERALSPGEKRRETSVIFDDIFPERTGTITSVAANYLSFVDSSMDFDLNGNVIEGETAKVLFKSGKLGGKQFEIGYNHSSRTFSLKPLSDGNGTTYPNEFYYPEIGNKYSIVGIYQPQSYIDNAEARLKKATEDSFKKIRPPYMVEIDEKYMRENGFKINSGDRVRLKDTTVSLQVDDIIRVTSVSFPLVNPNKCTVVISDKLTYTKDVQVVLDQGKIKEDVKVVDKNVTEYNKSSAQALKQFMGMVFDPDGGLTDELRVLMIEAMSGVFGAESQHFDLQGVFIKANVDGNPNKITFTDGKLIHYRYEIEGFGNVWTMASLMKNDLLPGIPYYISAKCSKEEPKGTWVVSPEPIGIDHFPGYWNFNLGVISSVVDRQRFTNITKGYTFITGGQIQTERLIAQLLKLPYITIGKDGRNAIEVWYDLAQTKLAITLGLVNGKPQMIWYDEITGNEIWNASKNGIIYVTSVPESWKQEGLLLVQSIPARTTPLDPVPAGAAVQLNANKVNDHNIRINSSIIAQYYDAGNNNETSSNTIYQGYHTTNIKTSPMVENGFYVITGVEPNYELFLSENYDNYFNVPVAKMWNGNIIDYAYVNVYVGW